MRIHHRGTEPQRKRDRLNARNEVGTGKVRTPTDWIRASEVAKRPAFAGVRLRSLFLTRMFCRFHRVYQRSCRSGRADGHWSRFPLSLARRRQSSGTCRAVVPAPQTRGDEGGSDTQTKTVSILVSPPELSWTSKRRDATKIRPDCLPGKSAIWRVATELLW